MSQQAGATALMSPIHATLERNNPGDQKIPPGWTCVQLTAALSKNLSTILVSCCCHEECL